MYLIYSVFTFLPYSKVIQLYLYLFFFIYGLSQNIDCSSLCYLVGSWCLSVLCKSLHLLTPSFAIPSPLYLPFPFDSLICSLCLWSLFRFIYIHLRHILDSTYKVTSNTIFVFLFDLLHFIWPAPVPSLFSNGIILFFLWLSSITIITYHIFLLPFICPWTFSGFPSWLLLHWFLNRLGLFIILFFKLTYLFWWRIITLQHCDGVSHTWIWVAIGIHISPPS